MERKGIFTKTIKKVIIVTILLTLVAGWMYYERLPDYRVYHSYAMSGDNFRDVDIDIIVYKYYHSEKLYKEIELDHNRINPTPTKLVINLYYTKNAILKGKEPYTKITIDYVNNTYVIE